MPSFFTKIIERGPNHVPVPPPLNTKSESILSILHNHRPLAENLWPNAEITSTDTQPNTTIFMINEPGDRADFKATFTNFDNGLSVLEQGDMLGMKVTVRWKVVAGDRDGTWGLEENVWLACFRPLAWIARFRDGFVPKTEKVLGLLDRVTAGDGDDVRATGADVDAGKRKSE